jgi:hypothetical protein
VLNALINVRFGGKNGHDAGVTPFPLMTLSGHWVSHDAGLCRST